MKKAMMIMMVTAAAFSACSSPLPPPPAVLPAASPARKPLAAVIAECRSEKDLALLEAGDARLYRGRGAAYWRERILHGDFEFGAWGGTLCIATGPNENENILSHEEWENGAITLLLVDLMDDKDPFVRSIAACGLAKYKRGPWEKAAIASLVVALDDEAYDVRLEAASSLLRSRIQLAPEVESVVEDIQRQEWEKAASAGHPLR